MGCCERTNSERKREREECETGETNNVMAVQFVVGQSRVRTHETESGKDGPRLPPARVRLPVLDETR